jgi:hypothetical protein
VGITKEKHHHFPPESRQAARLAIKIGKLKISFPMLPGDVFGKRKSNEIKMKWRIRDECNKYVVCNGLW